MGGKPHFPIISSQTDCFIALTVVMMIYWLLLLIYLYFYTKCPAGLPMVHIPYTLALHFIHCSAGNQSQNINYSHSHYTYHWISNVIYIAVLPSKFSFVLLRYHLAFMSGSRNSLQRLISPPSLQMLHRFLHSNTMCYVFNIYI